VPPGRLCACTDSRDAASRPASAMPRESTLGGRDTVTMSWNDDQSTKDRVLVISLGIANGASARSAGTSANAMPKNLMLLLIAKRRRAEEAGGHSLGGGSVMAMTGTPSRRGESWKCIGTASFQGDGRRPERAENRPYFASLAIAERRL
jgi:hypothetical protein